MVSGVAELGALACVWGSAGERVAGGHGERRREASDERAAANGADRSREAPSSIVAAPPDVVSGVTSLAPTVAQLAGHGDEAVTQVVSFTHAVAPVLETQPATDSAVR